MLTAIDSFVKFLSNALDSVIPVRFVRQDELDPASNTLRENVLNVKMLDAKRQGHQELLMVSLDLIMTSERQAWAVAKAVVDVLFAGQMIPEYDYETSGTPSTGLVVSWSGNDLDFTLVGSDGKYIHLNSTFNIGHVRVAG